MGLLLLGRLFSLSCVKYPGKLLSKRQNPWELTTFIRARLNHILNVKKLDTLDAFQRDQFLIIQMSVEQTCHKGIPGECPCLNQPPPLSSCACRGKAIIPFSHESQQYRTPLPSLPGQMGAGGLLEVFKLFHLSLRPWSRTCRGDPGLFVSSVLPIYTESLFPKVLSWQCLSRGKCPVIQPPDETATSPTEETSSVRELQVHLPALGIKASWQLVVSSHEKSWILPHGRGQSLCWPVCWWKVEGEFRQRRNSRGENRCKKFLGMLQKSTSPPLLLPNQPT